MLVRKGRDKMKKVKILTITLVIILVAMIAFGGIYVQYQNRMENKVKDYSYAMDLKGTRNIRLKVNTETKTIIKDSEGKEVEDSSELTDEQIAEKGYTKEEQPKNSDDVKNVENYKKSKEVIEKRLKKLGVDNYIIKLDEQTGDIIVEITENDKTDSIVSNINTAGKFEIVDSETNEVLMTNDDIKTSSVLYGSGSSTTSQGTAVYLNIEFTKEGSKKLEDISTKYVKVEETEDTTEDENTNETTDETENAESTEESEETTEKKITMKIDDEEIMSTSFDEILKTGKLQLSIGTATTDKNTLQGYIDQATSMATVLDTGRIPVVYDVDANEYILSDITENEIQIGIYVILGLIVIALIVLMIRYKMLGVLGAISFIGLAGLLTILIRYANVVLSIEGMVGIVIVLILNYVFINKLLSKLKEKGKYIEVQDVKNANKETNKEFFMRIIPIIIMVITFCFIKWIPISSFGMVMFWGIVLIAVYNVIVTYNLFKIKASNQIGGKKNNEETK